MNTELTTQRLSARRLAFPGALAVAVTAIFLSLFAGSAAAEGIRIESFTAGSFQADGSPSTQAGEHPYALLNDFVLNTESRRGAFGLPVEFPVARVKDVDSLLPPGVIGNAAAFPACSRADLSRNSGLGDCPVDSQVGVITLMNSVGLIGPLTPYTAGVYNIAPGRGDAADLGFIVNAVPVHIRIGVDPADHYRVRARVTDTSQAIAVGASKLTLWGIPGDSSHTPLRGPSLRCEGDISDPSICSPAGGYSSGSGAKPFLSNPTSCGPQLETENAVNSWADPSFWAEATSLAPATTGCERLVFEPRIAGQPSTTKADAPAGLSFDLKVPQVETATGLATPALRKAVVTLPQGVRFSPSAADGLGGCTDSEVGIGTYEPISCPDSSRLGEVRVTTPLLSEELSGGVFLGEPLPGNPYRVFLVANAPERGVSIRLEGRIDLDPVTGQVTTTFDDNPELPFSDLSLTLKSGARAPLVTPRTCGTYAVTAELTPWSAPASGPPEQATSSFTVDRDCEAASRFTPALEAGTTNPVAGQSSPFTLRVTRPDGQPNVSAIEATLPEGVLAKLGGVALCAEAQASTGDCPGASRVGATTVGVGAGSSPLFVPQAGKAPTAVYLAGPYKSAPYSLVVKVPAQAGPFDLGTVTVRNALFVDPTTAQVTTKSDPLPQILKGIPISYRDIRVNVDRPDFTLNPTSCNPMAITSTIGSAGGATANPSSRFQVANCERLAFAPKLALSVKGSSRRGAYQRLKAVLTMPKGDNANIATVSVTLPHSQFLAQNHIRTICTRVQYAGKACPPGSVYGYAKAYSPLLDKPLRGPVYLRSSNNPLPDLVAALDGQIHIDLAGRIDSIKGGIRSTFSTVPDAPVSKFVLEMKGGKKSLLVNSRNLCKSTNRATVKMGGQNGKVHDFRPELRSSGCGG